MPGVAYLDHAATAPLRPEALAAMLPVLTDGFGNPSGAHQVARAARRALDEARDVLALHLGCQPGEVVLTAGGTEADNLAVAGVVSATGGTAACTAVEHHAVLHAVEAVGGRVVAVDAAGRVDLDRLADALDERVALVSVQAANGEVGVLQPLEAVADLVEERAPEAALHVDAVQAAPWLDLATLCRRARLVSVAAHKLGGPKGVGCLVVRAGTPLRPMLLGGGQERDRRSGTQDVAGAVGFAAALAAVAADREEAARRVAARRDALLDRLAAAGGVVETLPRHVPRLPGHAHVRVAGCESEALLVLLDDAGVCASAGSACASGAMEPSHVLTAMGVPKAEALTSLRLTLGPTTTEADVARAVEAVTRGARRLRGA